MKRNLFWTSVGVILTLIGSLFLLHKFSIVVIPLIEIIAAIGLILVGIDMVINTRRNK